MKTGNLSRERGERLRQARLAMQLSQQEVASRIGMSKQWVSLAERGGALPSERLAELAILYQHSTDYILFGPVAAPLSGDAMVIGRQYDALPDAKRREMRLLWDILARPGAAEPSASGEFEDSGRAED